MTLSHYLDPLAPYPRRTSSRPTYAIHVKRRITARVVAIAHYAVFLPTYLRQPQECRIFKPPHVAMPTLSIPRTCNPLFPTAVNSTFYEQTSAGRASTPGELPSCVDNADNVLMRISQLRCFCRIPIRIPKSCRIPVTEAITSASNTDWNNLVFFPILACLSIEG